MPIARNGAHFFFPLKPKSVTAKSIAPKAASELAIKEFSRYIPFHVLAGKAAQIAIAMISKIIFAVIKRVRVLCGLALEAFGILFSDSISKLMFFNFTSVQ